MAVPVSQALTVATYVMKQKLLGRKKYPLVLMLEPSVPLQPGLCWVVARSSIQRTS